MSGEDLRELLAEVYVGAFSGLGAMLLDEDRIRNAGGGGARGACTGFIKVICCILLTIKFLMPADA